MRADLGSDLWRKLVANLLDPANQPLNLRWVESLSREGYLNKPAVTLGFYSLAGFQARIDGQVIKSLRWPLDAPGQQALAAALELAQAGYDALYRTAWSQAMYSHKDREAAKSKVASIHSPGFVRAGTLPDRRQRPGLDLDPRYRVVGQCTSNVFPGDFADRRISGRRGGPCQSWQCFSLCRPAAGVYLVAQVAAMLLNPRGLVG